MAEAAPRLKGKNLNRSWVVRHGKRLRKRINPIIKEHSKVGDAPVLSNADFPWIETFEKEWPAIREEALNIARHKDAVPSISEISPDHKKLDNQKKWRSYFMWGYGFRSDHNCARCPATVRLVESVPGLRTALFSMHEPGMTIAPHKGVTAGICVMHLGLVIPKDRENCAIRVADEIVHWEEGKAFVFDDTYKHETWNNTDEQRIILLLHFDRPLRFPGNLLSKIFMAGIRYSPFVSDARRQMIAWEKTFKESEKEAAHSKERSSV